MPSYWKSRLRDVFRITPAPLSDFERKRLDLPLRVTSILFLLAAVGWALLEDSPSERLRILAVLVGGGVYVAVHYFWGRSRWNRSPWEDLAMTVAHALVVGWAALVVPPPAEIAILVFSSGILLYLVGLGGRMLGYLFAGVISVIYGLFGHATAYYGVPQIVLLGVFGAVVLTEMAAHWRLMLERQVKRLRAVNYVSQSLMSSIDPGDVITLLASTIQNALPADSYFVARLMDDVLRLDILYDEGEVFGPMDLDKDAGLAGWVLNHRRSLLLNNVPEQIEQLGLERRIVGRGRPNLSWMGSPMEAGQHLIGLLAVGSYRYNAFDETDLEMLESIAQQAALAFDNAHHHQQIEEQARRDSLTGVYNHGYFLERLEQLIQISVGEDQSLGVIMLDVDFFKQYNDTFGHQLGDEVLIALARTIQQHVKHSDLVGRWGGEEFGIALPRVTVEQMYGIAMRIRETMASLRLSSRNGEMVPAPTVSQGFAMCPAEASDTYSLIALADRRLYQAKDHGRNRIMGPDGVFPPEE